ncbi:hypothetical protein FGRMN_10520 [Fusarium graminum]|nr:hypothetical protein FGRMN_10520 [Fusarium graminum]
MRKPRVKKTLRGPSRGNTIDLSLYHQGPNEESTMQHQFSLEDDLYHESLCSIPVWNHVIDRSIPELIVLTFFNNTNGEDGTQQKEMTAGQEFERMCLDFGKAWMEHHHGPVSSSEEFHPRYGRSTNEIVLTEPAPVVYYQPGQAQMGLYSPMSFPTTSPGFPTTSPGFATTSPDFLTTSPGFPTASPGFPVAYPGYPPAHPELSPAPIIFGPMPSGFPAAPSGFPAAPSDISWGI